MSHQLEQSADGKVTSLAFAGDRADIWHRLGQAFGTDGADMTAQEAMRAANLDRQVRTLEVPAPSGTEWAIPVPRVIILEGTAGMTADGELWTIPDKVVGLAGKGGAAAHESLSIRDRFDLAEEAIHASHGEAVWSTAGLLRDGRQGFATMRAPDLVVDPEGIADIIRNYMVLSWSFDQSRPTELAASHVRVVCANTLALADSGALSVIKVKHTSITAHDRMRLAAQHWAMAQDRTAALGLQAERLLAVRDGRAKLGRLMEAYDPRPDPDASKRAVTLWTARRDKLDVLWHAPTNAGMEDDGWRAWNTFVEYLDWETDVRTGDGETEADRRLGNQFDGAYDGAKSAAVDFLVSADA